MTEIVIGVLFAMFAVFGMICVVRLIVECCFPMDQIVMALEIRTKEDADALDMLMQEARSAFFRRGGTRIVILLSEELTENGEIPEKMEEVLDRYNAECYLVE